MTIETILKTIVRGIERESPTILIGLGITGIATTAILAVRATPKALYLLEEERAKRYADESKREPIGKIDTIKITWKCYLPAALVGITTAVCFIGANSINLRRNAALATLYSVSEAALKEYQEKVVETIGSNKERKIHEAILQDRLDHNPVEDKEVFITGKGTTLFFDTHSGRYFKSDMETVRKIQNDINSALIGGELYISLNSFYYDLGLENVASGDDIGWEADAQLDIKFTSRIAHDSVPCIVMEYAIHPKDL